MSSNPARFGLVLKAADAKPIPIFLFSKADAEALPGLAPAAAELAQANGFKGEAGRFLVLPDGTGGRVAVLGTGDAADPFVLAAAASAAPDGLYALHGADALSPEDASRTRTIR